MQGSESFRRVAAIQAIALSASRFAPGAAQILIVLAAARTRGPATTGVLAFGSVMAQFISIAVDFGAGDALLQRGGWGIPWQRHRRAIAKSKLAFAVAAVALGVVASFLVGEDYRGAVLAAALLGAVLGFTPALTARLVLAERAGCEAAVAWTETVLTATVGVGLLLAGHGAASVLVSLVVVRFLGNAVRAFIPTHPQASDTLEPVATAVLMKAGSGFAVNIALNILFLQTDVLILAALGSPGELGIYQVAWRLVYFPLTAIEALHTVLLPRLAARFKENGSSADFVRLHWPKYLLAGIAWCLALLMLGDFASQTLFGPSFASSGALVRILALGMPIRFLSYFVALILASQGHQWRRAAASAAYAPIAIIVMLGAAQAGGAAGLCWGGVVGQFVAFGCLAAALKSIPKSADMSTSSGRKIPDVMASCPVRPERVAS